MSRVFEVDPERLEEAGVAVRAAARAVAEGAVVVFPTETVYGMAARPDLSSATRRLFAVKRRPAALNLPVLVSDPAAGWRLGVATPEARRLADRYWPGPLTLVLRRTRASSRWDLGEHTGSVAVRVPAHAVARRLLVATGPLAATSANPSGAPPIEDPEALVETFGDDVAVFLVLAPGAARPSGIASTVVDLTGDEALVTRKGTIEAPPR
ncbi:MAG: threonylcarbamoyl-AMP synthase [Actinobacteria bacterium]|nr:threonylcarbamoyl-AMP synthase [Actinomycetota bacterium]